MDKAKIISDITEDVTKLINKFNDAKRYASQDRLALEKCYNIVEVQLPLLARFAEKYLGIKIEIDYDHPGIHGQYDPGRINGYAVNFTA